MPKTVDVDTVPLRKGTGAGEIETRPLYVEKWLDSLPYVDFEKTSRLILESTKATNQLNIKPSVRLELVRLYSRPYQYYLDSQLRTGAQHTLQSIETMQGQINILKQIATNLWLGCKAAIEGELERKTFWGQSKPPLPAMLMMLNFLAHNLIFSYLEYAPEPKALWREINYLLLFAEQIGQENATVIPLGGNANRDATTIARAYKRITLTALTDPNSLPFGAVWEIYQQFASWSEHAQITKYKPVDNQASHFVVDLNSDIPPRAYAKYDVEGAGEFHRVIDATPLAKLVEKQIEKLEWGEELNSGIQFSPYYVKNILAHLSKAYGYPPERDFPRIKKSGAITLAHGINTIYFHLNGKQEFSLPQEGVDEIETGMAPDDAQSSADKTADYATDEWELLDLCPGGFAAIRNSKPVNPLRVGDLIGINAGNGGEEEKWGLGVIRWLTVIQNKSYKIGIQRIAPEIHTASVRATNGSLQDKLFRRALITEDLTSIITEKGLYEYYRELEISYQNKIYKVHANALVGGSVNYEQFSFTSQ